jgi:hypothetical protein
MQNFLSKYWKILGLLGLGVLIISMFASLFFHTSPKNQTHKLLGTGSTPAYDPGTYVSGSGNGTEFFTTGAMTTSGGNNLVVCGVHTTSNAGPVSSITATGMTFTKATSTQVGATTGNGEVEVWTATTSAQIVATTFLIQFSNSQAPQSAGGCAAFTGTDQSGPTAAIGNYGFYFADSSNIQATTTTSRANSLVIGVYGQARNISFTAGTGNTVAGQVASAGGFSSQATQYANANTANSGTVVASKMTLASAQSVGGFAIELKGPYVPPTVMAKITIPPVGPTIMVGGTMTASSASSTGNIVRQEWNWNEGNGADVLTQPLTHGQMSTHRFMNAGTTTLSLTVWDDQGNYNSTTTMYRFTSASNYANGTFATSSQIVARAVPGNALTYYIDSTGGGSDAADGLSPATAWATLRKATSTLYASPPPGGSSILFKAGGTYDTQGEWDLHQRSAATGFADWGWMMSPPYYITLGSYGTGAKPIIKSVTGTPNAGDWGVLMTAIDGSDTINGKGIIIDGLDIQAAGASGGALWIKSYLLSDGAGGFFSEIPGLNVTIRNSKLSGGVYFDWGGTVAFENNILDGTGLGNVVTFGTNAYPYFATVASSTIRNAGNHCIYFSGGSRSSLLMNNDIYNCGQSVDRDGMTFHGGVSTDINAYFNDIHDSQYCAGFDANTIGTTPYESLRQVVFNGNKCRGLTSHYLQIRSVKDLTISNNQFYNSTAPNDPILWFMADAGNQATQNVKVYNNTFFSNSAGIMKIDATSTANSFGTLDVNFYNNLVSTTPTLADAVINDARAYNNLATSTYLNLNNNNYYGTKSGNAFTANGMNFTLTQWLTNNENASITTNPNILNLATFDLRPATSSPMINAGASKLIPYDFLNVARSTTTPTIGAFEWINYPAPTPSNSSDTNIGCN